MEDKIKISKKALDRADKIQQKNSKETISVSLKSEIVKALRTIVEEKNIKMSDYIEDILIEIIEGK